MVPIVMEYLLSTINPGLLAIAANIIPVRQFSAHELNLRRREGEFHILYIQLKEDPQKFHSYMRMTRECFEYMAMNMRPKPSTNFIVCPISNEERLMLTIRMGVSTVRQIIYETCDEIWELFSEIHLFLPTQSKFEDIAREFENRWNFPNCLGSVDGKHIRIKNPPRAGTLYFNYRKFFSIVLQGVVDANYRFICIDVGAYGRQHDAATFRQSMFHDVVIKNQANIPDTRPLPGDNIPLPFVFVGDEAYPLLPNLMRPYPKQSLNPETQYYNDRLSRARKTVECAFGILSAKWRLLWKPMEIHPKKADSVVKTMCLLHNMIIDIDGPVCESVVRSIFSSIKVSRTQKL